MAAAAAESLSFSRRKISEKISFDEKVKRIRCLFFSPLSFPVEKLKRGENKHLDC